MEKSVVLDICKHPAPAVQTFVLRQGDSNSLTLNILVNEDGAPFDLSGCEARFMARLRNGKTIIDLCEPAGGNAIRYTLTSAITALQGTVGLCYIAVYRDGEWVASTNCMRFVVLQGVDISAEEAESYVSEFMKLKAELEQLVKDAEDQQTLQRESWEAQMADQRDVWLSQTTSQKERFEDLETAIGKALESLESVTIVSITNTEIDALWADY